MEAIFDILIGVLFIALPVIFKAIGNGLEKSGKTDKAKKFRNIAEAMTDDERSVLDEMETPRLDEILEKRRVAVYGENYEEELADTVTSVSTVPSVPPVPEVKLWNSTPQTKAVEVRRQVQRKKVLLEEAESVRKGERIDPKKLVIYSEIMKPKF